MKETQATRQIHSLSDEEVSRWIAEKLEPFGSLPFHTDGTSPLNVWFRNKRFTGHTFEWYWQPRDMVNDAQMTVMLLEKLLASLRENVTLAKAPNGGVYFCGWATCRPHECASSLGRAIAESWMLANGYREC